MNKSDKILVTGDRGMLGQTLISKLAEQGYENIIGSRGDLRKEMDVTKLLEYNCPDYVFHCAASVYGIGGNARQPADILQDNVLMNTHVVSASRWVGSVKKILCMGSGCVYPYFPFQQYEIGFSEKEVWDGPPHPSEAAYAHAKRLMLAHLEAEEQQHGLNYAYVISGNLYGPNDRFNTETGHVIPSLIAKFFEAEKTKEPVIVWGDGSAIRDFIYVEDAAEALIQIMNGYDGPINMGSGEQVKIWHAVTHLMELFPGVKVDFDNTKPNGQEVRVYNLDKLKALGFKPNYTLQEGLKETVAWYRVNNYVVRK